MTTMPEATVPESRLGVGRFLARLWLTVAITMWGFVGSELRAFPGQIHVDDRVWLQLEKEGTASYAVFFHGRADLSPAYGMTWNERGRYVIRVLQDAAKVAQPRAVERLARSGSEFERFWIDNLIIVEGSDMQTVLDLLELGEIRALRALPEIHLIEPAEIFEPHDLSPFAPEPNLEHVNAPDAWGLGFTGEGMVVGIMDSGPRHTHQALVSQYRGHLGDDSFDHQHSWWDPLNSNAVPSWGDHGTHVAGIVAGDDENGNQIGIAPGAMWIACELFPCATAACALTCAEFMLAPWNGSGANPDPDLRPHIVNNSWGSGGCVSAYDDWYQGAIDAWHAAGIVPVFANGNANNCGHPSPPPCDTVINPARYGNVLGVGSTGRDNATYAHHSLKGPTDHPWPFTGAPFDDFATIKPNVVAPGVSIRSARAGSDTHYGLSSGTSMSAPHVTGLVALLWQAAPCLIGDYPSTAEIIMSFSTALPYSSGCGGEGPGEVPNHATGWGEIDALAIVLAGEALCGDIGSIEGVVTSAVTLAPLEGAFVQVVGRGTRSASSKPNGSFQIEVMPGTYDVMASKDGFFPQTLMGVTVGAAQATIVDFSLDSAPVAEISPSSFTFEHLEGESDSDILSVGNAGRAELTWSITTDVPWLDADPGQGATAPSPGPPGRGAWAPVPSVPVTVLVDATGLEEGLHEGNLLVSTNDPTQPQIVVPVELTVPDACTIGPSHLMLESMTLTGTEVFEACRTIIVGGEVTIASTADITLRAGEKIILRNGVAVEAGASFTAEISQHEEEP